MDLLMQILFENWKSDDKSDLLRKCSVIWTLSAKLLSNICLHQVGALCHDALCDGTRETREGKTLLTFNWLPNVFTSLSAVVIDYWLNTKDFAKKSLNGNLICQQKSKMVILVWCLIWRLQSNILKSYFKLSFRQVIKMGVE